MKRDTYSFSNTTWQFHRTHSGVPDKCVSNTDKLWKVNTGTFFHHYQGSIEFNTVNIHLTVGMYFLVSTGNRGDIE